MVSDEAPVAAITAAQEPNPDTSVAVHRLVLVESPKTTLPVGVGLPGTAPMGGPTLAVSVTGPPEAGRLAGLDETVMVGTGLTVTVIVPEAPVETLVPVTV